MKKQRKRIYTALLSVFYCFCAGIGGRNGAGGNDCPVKYKGSRYRGKRTGYD